MLNASALVVGVDRYDVPEIPVLSGCVNDAFAATEWLLKIGVSPNRIFLHLAPSGSRGIQYAGVTTAPADLDSILGSITALSKGGGDQLFVFMSGHGLYVPADGAIFLPQDYGVNGRTRNNLKIDEYVRWFLSWAYRDQFLFYDACQNATASIGQVKSCPGGWARPSVHGLCALFAQCDDILLCGLARPDRLGGGRPRGLGAPRPP